MLDVNILNKLDKAQEKEQRILKAYKAVFSGDLGQLVLLDMLYELYFLRPCETSEQQALCNFAKKLLAIIYGIDIEPHKLKSIIRKVLLKRRTK